MQINRMVLPRPGEFLNSASVNGMVYFSCHSCCIPLFYCADQDGQFIRQTQPIVKYF